MRFADRNPQAKILIGFICMKARHRSAACSYLMQVTHNALKSSVNTHTTAIASRCRYLCNRETCPDGSHRSVAAVRLRESVRDRLVASWNKAVADAAARSQPPIPAVTLTPMAAALVIPAAGKTWRISEKAPPPQPSKSASFFKETLEQARLAGLTDDEISCVAAALTPVLEKEERSGDTGRSTKRGALPEARSSRTITRGKAVLELPTRQFEHREQLLQTDLTTSTAATTTTAGAPSVSVSPAPLPVTQFLGTGRHPRTADREETLRVLMRKTKISGHPNVDTDVADYDDHYLVSLFVGRTKSGLISLGPDELGSKHKIRVNLKIGTKNTRIGVPRELEGWI